MNTGLFTLSKEWISIVCYYLYLIMLYVHFFTIKVYRCKGNHTEGITSRNHKLFFLVFSYVSKNVSNKICVSILTRRVACHLAIFCTAICFEENDKDWVSCKVNSDIFACQLLEQPPTIAKKISKLVDTFFGVETCSWTATTSPFCAKQKPSKVGCHFLSCYWYW